MGRAAQWQPSGENLGSKKSEMRYVAPRVTVDRILRRINNEGTAQGARDAKQFEFAAILRARQAQSRRGGFARLSRGGSVDGKSRDTNKDARVRQQTMQETQKHFPSPSETRSGRLHTNSALSRVQDRGLDHGCAAARKNPSGQASTHAATLLSITLARCAQLAERPNRIALPSAQSAA
ncbi:hypothetical protein MYCTH_2122065 [Thermothelomyces thermophilus ATCC 42464]|uniref:Uncharacterized protein n=1 Tax=Thermothelomyces thermophilus (strain ATCC 42464 / BCRC 31852 / DSM 1799) TaxID=573729 RepID=G2Q0S6_THET4|nr:uncharacterized protein MYCTH_2122065 [Thermothelomyces thermophilus ATCC 42464]AEO53226.1 hypothetical protein MYCTH_2122065 [Thermothelomyces thermophilus ATCC 42464]